MEVRPMVGMLPGEKDNFYDRLYGSMILPSSIIEFYPDATLVIDNEGRVVAWNKAMEKMTGVAADHMLGKGNYEYSMPFYGERKPMLLNMVGLPRSEVNDRYTSVVMLEDKLEALTIKAKVKGRDVVLWGAAARLYGLNGKPVGAIESIRDVTSQKAVEKRLMESEEKYRMITTSTNDGIVTLDLKGIIDYVNPRAQKMVGLPADVILGRHFTDFVAKDYIRHASKIFCRGMSGMSIVPFEIEVIDGSGKLIPIEINGGALETDGVRKGAIVAFRDVSERWKARKELKKAHEELERRVEERTLELARASGTLQATLDTIPASIMVAHADTGRISYANRFAIDMFGESLMDTDFYSEARPFELLRPDRTLIVAKDRPLYRSLRGGERAINEEMTLRKADGRELAVLLSSAPIQGESGQIVGAVASAIDITERKHIESALKESEKRFRVMAETAASAIFIYQGGLFRYVNPATCMITGYSREELLSMNFWDWVHPDFQEIVKRNAHARRHGLPAPSRYEVKFVTKGGEERWMDLTPGLIEFNKKPAVIVTGMDVTDRKRAEEALKNAKENAEMYLDLMGHDINNMNQVAMGYLEMSLDVLPADDPVTAYLIRSYSMLQDSSRLIDNLRKVQQAVGRKLKLETVDLGALLSEVAAKYAMVPGRDITIEYSRAECHVMANLLLKDVFSNIVGNAIKHSTGPLTVSIGVRAATQNGKRYCEVSIDDTGPGIPAGLKETIFSRSKRGDTKAGGSGLGLYLVKSLVESFHGRVWAEDRIAGEPGKGSRFVVQLPSAD